ncbi:MAG: hypothetical protein BECKG1743D_GA0114223_102011, partial [Candidatus Kentron sp. G]
MAQQPFCLVVGQWQIRVRKHSKDRLPIIEEFASERTGFFMRCSLHGFAQFTKFLEQ